MIAGPPVRIAIIGLGEAGARIHVPALREVPGAILVGAYDSDPARLTAARRDGLPVFEDLDALLARTAPDVVTVATPPDSHAHYALRGLEAGAHVLCEKPFVTSLADADAVITAAARAGRRVALNHEFRMMPIFAALVAAARASEASPLRFVEIRQLVHLPPGEEGGWRGRLARRTLYEAGVHLLDLLLALFDETPHAVAATVASGGASPADVDAAVLVTLEFSGGRLGHVLQYRMSRGERQYMDVRAETDASSLRASFGGRARLSAGLLRSARPHVRLELGPSGLAWREMGTRRTVLARNPTHPTVRATRAVYRDTLAAFATGAPAPTEATRARAILEVTAAAYRSAELGSKILLNGESGPALRHFDFGATRAP